MNPKKFHLLTLITVLLSAILLFLKDSGHLSWSAEFLEWLRNLAIAMVAAAAFRAMPRNLALIVFAGLVGLAAVLVLFPVSSLPFYIPEEVRWAALGGLMAYALHKESLTTWIFFSMIAGIMTGYDNASFAVELNLFSKIFIRLIKIIIAPLLFSTLVVGIAGHSDLKQVGRLGVRAMGYFLTVTTIALCIGLGVANWVKPGAGIVNKEVSPELQKTEIKKQPTGTELFLDMFPENIVKSIHEGKVLQIVIFSILFGIALALVPEDKKMPMLHFAESLSETMFKLTGLIMYVAPVGVGAAIAYTVGHMGIDILKNLGMLVACLYLALFILILVVLVPIALVARINIPRFVRAIAEPVSIAFATTSSDSALPKAMEALEKLGVPRKIISFVLPMGYSFNLDGTTLYLSLATIFVAQAANIPLSASQQFTILAALMLSSKGVAAVPRASLVILSGTAMSFGLPAWPIYLILGVDELMDMARTATNVIGNCLATVVLAKWEGEYQEPAEEIEG